MENRGLIFIPDISGFTKFVNETEVDHSRLIMEELLEVIISNNKIGLEISEIEGDAILFYKWGKTPSLSELYDQVAQMFCSFHESILAYDYGKYCQCKACTSAADLTLKVITHYGEFTAYQVRDFKKLIGKDLIVAHQLLKNEIDRHEYWLVTENIVGSSPPDDLSDEIRWHPSSKTTESGTIRFNYTPLGFLREKIAQPLPVAQPLQGKKKVLTYTRTYQTDIITLFHATGDFNLRQQWTEGIKTIEEVNHYLPRVGMKCRCVTDDGESYLTSTSYTYTEDTIGFTETDDRGQVTQYYLQKISPSSTQLTIDYFIPDSLFQLIIFSSRKKAKTEKQFLRSLDNLSEFLITYKVPVLL